MAGNRVAALATHSMRADVTYLARWRGTTASGHLAAAGTYAIVLHDRTRGGTWIRFVAHLARRGP